jgi:hypothetical protein
VLDDGPVPKGLDIGFRGIQRREAEAEVDQAARRSHHEDRWRHFRAVQVRHWTKPEKKKGGPVVHYAFGTLMGAAYGATVEIAPSAKTLSGIPFGTILFAGADEVAVLALGLSKSRAAYPIASHAYGLASHAVYGITAELVRRLIRSKIWARAGLNFAI